VTATPETLPDNDTYYMGIAMAVRQKANCTGNRIGAVLVLENRVISTGYNGVPEGMRNCLEGGCLRCRNPQGRFPTGTGYDLCICVISSSVAKLLLSSPFASTCPNDPSPSGSRSVRSWMIPTSVQRFG
jgi:deoxycytidylate deaminase